MNIKYQYVPFLTEKEKAEQLARQLSSAPETHVSYHAEYRFFNGQWRRGCYAHIAESYGGTFRIYASSYTELVNALEIVYD